jgi:ubiquitin-protein ligase
MPFPGLWGSYDRILMVRKRRLINFSMSKFTICLQCSSTKWAKAYLINYILEKLQESMGTMILCSLSWIM